MDDTRIEKRIGVQATSDRLWELIADLSWWDRWNPHETGVEGTIAYGGRLSLDEAYPDMAPRRANGQVVEWQPRVKLVWVENRGFLFRSARYLHIEELDRGSCILASGVRFAGLRGELFHDKHRPRIRQAQEAIVEGLKAAAEA